MLDVVCVRRGGGRYLEPYRAGDGSTRRRPATYMRRSDAAAAGGFDQTRLNQPSGRDRLVRVERQRSQRGALLRRTGVHAVTAVVDPQPPQDPELHIPPSL